VILKIEIFLLKNELNGEEMEFNSLFRRYFKELKDDSQDKEDDEFAENIHVIATINPVIVATVSVSQRFNS
jgi:hypothetical protein